MRRPADTAASCAAQFIVGYQGPAGTGKEAFVARVRGLAAKYGERFNTALIGVCLVIAGAVGLVVLVHRPTVVMVAALCFVIGCGLGLSALPV
jgi:hypothetical protein